MFATQAYILISLILPKLMGSGNNNTPAVLMKAGKLQCSSTSMLGPVADTSQFQHQNAAVRNCLWPEGQNLPKTATSALLICSEGCFRHVAGTFQILLALIALAVASSSLPIQLWYLFFNCCIYKFPLSRCEKQRQFRPNLSSRQATVPKVCRCGLLAPCSEELGVVLHFTHYCRGRRSRPKRIAEKLVLEQSISIY